MLLLLVRVASGDHGMELGRAPRGRRWEQGGGPVSQVRSAGDGNRGRRSIHEVRPTAAVHMQINQARTDQGVAERMNLSSARPTTRGRHEIDDRPVFHP